MKCCICDRPARRGIIRRRRFTHTDCWRMLSPDAVYLQDEMGNRYIRTDPVPPLSQDRHRG